MFSRLSPREVAIIYRLGASHPSRQQLGGIRRLAAQHRQAERTVVQIRDLCNGPLNACEPVTVSHALPPLSFASRSR
jgi:hypothetical protein